MPDGGSLSSLFEFMALNGFPQVPQSVNVQASVGPCDISLSNVVNQSVSFLLTSRGFSPKDFKFSSNCVAILVLGWAIARYNLTELLLECALSNVEQHKRASLAGPESECMPLGDVKAVCDKLSWIVGRLRLMLKSLAVEELHQAHLLHQVHQRTQGLCISADADHLTMSQIDNLTCVEDVEKFLCRIQHGHLVISSYLKWKEGESTFWTWMESLCTKAELPDEFTEFLSLVQHLLSGPDLHVRLPRASHSPGSDTTIQKVTGSLKKQLGSIDAELERLRHESREALTQLGFSCEVATFMPSIF
ncbi:uncharacterized protein LOC135398148 isoform X1 [Ornithodoros turicata]|uniref:uncharacterized protein LOC135398148 isoform X1 n=1 Tax=Ornithodoros turicata TaxID=34597 RepID=UPI00313A14BD